jgi:hypothetical protein
LENEEWGKEYRALKVLEAQINSVIGGFRMPFSLFCITCSVVVCTTLVLRIHLGLTPRLVFSLLAAISFFAISLLGYFASNSAVASDEAIARQRKRCRSRRDLRVFLAFRPFGFKSGSFRTLDRDASLTLMMANLDYTVSAILAF